MWLSVWSVCCELISLEMSSQYEVSILSKRKRVLAIDVSSAKKMGDGFVSAWKNAEKGNPPVEPVNRLHFSDTSTLFKYLSPKRFELLQCLREFGPLSIRKLASSLQRDYKNVHTDVKDLMHVGLIEETSDGQCIVPWDSIVSELSLLAKAT